MSASAAITIGTVVVGTLQSLSNTPSWREKYYSEQLRKANYLGNKLNAKKEALMQSFETAYTKMARQHDLEKLNFNNLSNIELNKALAAFDKYGNSELVNKYDRLNKEYNDYISKNKTLLESAIAKASGGKVSSLSSLAKIHNDKIDDVVSEWTNKLDKHDKDIKNAIDSSRERDANDLNSKREEFSNKAKNDISKAEVALNGKHVKQQEKLQKQKQDKYNTLADAVNSANDWIYQLENGSAKHSTTWKDHLYDFLDAGNQSAKQFTESKVKADSYLSKDKQEKLDKGLNLDINFNESEGA